MSVCLSSLDKVREGELRTIAGGQGDHQTQRNDSVNQMLLGAEVGPHGCALRRNPEMRRPFIRVQGDFRARETVTPRRLLDRGRATPTRHAENVRPPRASELRGLWRRITQFRGF